MSEPLSNPMQKPESYGPKKPEIIEMAEELLKNENITLPSAFTIENILSPDEPWVGGCRYLLCLTSLYMHTEHSKIDYYADEATKTDFNGNFGLSGDGAALPILNRERIYKVFLTVTGMGLINHWDINGQYQNYEKTVDYVARSMKFCGYKYENVPALSAETIMSRVKISICSDIPVLAYYRDGWELIVGYDATEGMLILRKGAGTVEKRDYMDELNYIICVTDTNGEMGDWKEFVSDVIKVMEAGEKGIGMQGYMDAINDLQNDALFENLTQEEQLNCANAIIWKYFVGHAEARGFSGQGFEWRFLNRYEEANKLVDLMNQISYYGDQHHQIAWCANNIFNIYGGDIRNRSVRDKLVMVIYYMIENDMQICRLLKKTIGLNTPDVLIPRNPETGEIYSTQIRTRDDINVGDIMARIRVKATRKVNFETDIESVGNVNLSIKNGQIKITSHNDVWGQDAAAIKDAVSFPFMVQMRVKTDDFNIHMYYSNAYISFRQHKHAPDSLYILDMLLGLYLGYPDKGIIPIDDFFDATWILHRDFMAVIVNGEVRHFGENYPYMGIIDILKEKFRFGTAAGNTITVEKMIISELE